MKSKSGETPGRSKLARIEADRTPKLRQRRNAVLTRPAPPTTPRGRATRDRLKAALVTLLQTHAIHEIRLEDIADAAHVRMSLIYHYFRNKTDIAHEVLADMLDAFRSDISARPHETPLEAIHYANLRMIGLYGSNPGAMRCMLDANNELTPLAGMWRDLTLEWNQRIARSLARQFPDAFASEGQYLSLAYALAGMVDNFLYEYFVLGNAALRKAYPSDEDLAAFLSTLWYRAVYLENPPTDLLKGRGWKGLGKRG